MYLNTLKNWHQHPNKRLMLFGMSGLGKTYIADLLRKQARWYHYSVDYRIGTRYMGEYITDNFKAEAMRNPFLEKLLRADAIYIASNITFENLSPLATYLGKPGDLQKGGIPFEDYQKRQDQHRKAEIASMYDTIDFIERAKRLYGYQDFICDTSGSMVEIVDADDPNDPIMSKLSHYMLPGGIKGDETHIETLVTRFSQAPKPMYYQPEFLERCWQAYLAQKNIAPDRVDPDDFIVWGYRQLLEHRLPRYEKLAQRWGVTLQAQNLQDINDVDKFYTLLSKTIEEKNAD